MQKAHRFSFYFLLINIATCCYFFFPIIGSLNSVLLSWGGDGLKNYFTYLYFVKYNHGTLFTGMNYPFGENIVFTDNMPVLAWTLAKLKIPFPHIADYALFFLHGMMMVSYFLCAVFVYKILKLFHVKGWWAIVSAIFIAYLSPQVIRLGAHFSLSLACVLPMIIYYMMQFQRKASFKYLVYLFLTIVFFTFCHVYFLAMALILILAFSVSYFITQKTSVKKKLGLCMPLLLTVVAAVATFKIYLLLTDKVTDRPQYPLGFLGAGTTGEDILTTGYNFLGRIFSIFFGEASLGSEGYTYVGIVTIIVALYLVFRIFKSLFFRMKRKQLIPSHPVRVYRAWLLTAVFCLIFAMGIPFVWGLEFLSEYISSLRQFRSIGRFSWIFYYLIMIYSAIVLYRAYYFYQRKNIRPKLIKALALLVVTAYVIEVNGYAQHIHDIYSNGEEHYKEFYNKGSITWEQHLKSMGHPVDKFQCMLLLPYFHIGSEQLGLQNVGEGYSILYGAQLSVQTGLPMMDVMMSRTSWSQTYEQVALFDGPFSPKKILNRFNKKPVLLLVNQYVPVSASEAWIIEQSKQIDNWAGFTIYEMNIDTLLSRKKIYEDSLIQSIKTDGRASGLLENKAAFSYNQHFDKLAYKDAFMGNGAFVPKGRTFQQEILTLAVEHPTNDTSFIFSAWFKCIPNSAQMPYLFFEEYDSNNKKIADLDFLAGQSTYKIENWFKAERVISIKKSTKYIKFYAMGGSKNMIAIDELLIHPLQTNYFYKYSDSLYFINNRPVKIK